MKNWKKIEETRDDFVNLSRYFPHPEGVVFARHQLQATEEQEKILYFSEMTAR